MGSIPQKQQVRTKSQIEGSCNWMAALTLWCWDPEPVVSRHLRHSSGFPRRKSSRLCKKRNINMGGS